MPSITFCSRFPWLTFSLLVLCIFICLPILWRLLDNGWFILLAGLISILLVVDFIVTNTGVFCWRLQGLKTLQLDVDSQWQSVELQENCRRFACFTLLDICYLDQRQQVRRIRLLLEDWTLEISHRQQLTAFLSYQRLQNQA